MNLSIESEETHMPITQYALQNAKDLGLRPQRLELLEETIQKFMAQGQRQAIVTRITRGGHVVFEGCYGTNTKPYGVKYDTLFSVASITKAVIATLFMCLQEDGRADIVEPVKTYLPEFTGGGRDEIYIWRLLTHTSGLRDDEINAANREYIKNELGLTPPEHGSPMEEWTAFNTLLYEKMGLDLGAENDRLNNADYLISLKHPMVRKPRSDMMYCNYGFQRLKEIIDVISGEPIDEFAQKRLFEPLGMKNTYWKAPEDKWGQILGRGENCEGFPFINSERYYQSESGAGGLKTTVEDITKFALMILGGGVFEGNRILSRRSIEEMTCNQNCDEGVTSYGSDSYAAWGYGWNVRTTKRDDTGILRSRSSIDHGGWAGTKILIDPQEDVTAAIFSAEYRTDIVPYSTIYAPIINVFYSALE